MADEKLLTVREVSLFLNISEKEVMGLADTGVLPAYKVGWVYLRFRKEQVEEYKYLSPLVTVKNATLQKNSLGDNLSDFFYFNDFYILAALIIILLLTAIFQG